MKVVNYTGYDTRVLRSIILAVYRQVRKQYRRDATDWKLRSFVILYNGQRRPADLDKHKPNWQLRVPPPPDPGKNMLKSLVGQKVSEPRVSEFAWLAWQFVMFSFGASRLSASVTPRSFAFLEREHGSLLPLAPERPEKPKKPVQQERYERIMTLKAIWLRKKRLAETKLKTLTRKQRYYEKTLKPAAEPRDNA